MANDKFLFVVSGAAGTGKDSVVKALREAHPEIEKTVSATTRAPRPGEQEGVDYYYRTREPVSYTHLDVYKRQPLHSARTSSSVGI